MSAYEQQLSNKKSHKVFLSYHHNPEDEYYKNVLVNCLKDVEREVEARGDEFVDVKPYMDMTEIKKMIRQKILHDTNVTIVLIGKDTWRRKHVDWEIHASLAGANFINSPLNLRSGLIGLLLPTHPSYKEDYVNRYTLPPRLTKNIENRYARLFKWHDNSPSELQDWVHEAFLNRYDQTPDDSYPVLKNNLTGDDWLH